MQKIMFLSFWTVLMILSIYGFYYCYQHNLPQGIIGNGIGIAGTALILVRGE